MPGPAQRDRRQPADDGSGLSDRRLHAVRMARFLKSAAALALIGAVAVMAPVAARAEGSEMRPLLVETTDGLGSLTVSNPGDRRI